MKISIITTCFNREATIRDCIESVLSQDYPDIEYIIVDGASTDRSLSIINEYKDRGHRPVYHFDFYRINRIEEAFDFGYEEYFYSGDLCLVEWPEKIEQLLPDNTMTVRITVDSDTARTFEID